MNFQKIIFIVGPTAVGKSEVAYSLAKRIDGEIISCDSMQVYKELRVVTSKPPSRTLRTVAHHLVGVISVREEFDVARFNTLALEAVKDIQSRWRAVIITGGSGLYMQVLLDGIFAGSPRDETLRRQFKEEAREYGTAHLYQQLQQSDPQAAAKIHLNDERRIIRALEVCRTRQQPISVLHHDRQGLWGKYEIAAFALTMDREKLYRRIDRRVEAMFAEGAVAEVKSLAGVPLGPTAERLIGLREIRGYLDGAYDQDHAKELMKRNTRHFAKRQLTWFRKEKRLQWITVGEDDTVEDVADRLEKYLSSSQGDQ
ncbi:MAG: tRNA (adenosine(37)-N6)-dimethylallyltransferase MiaA [Candidatus Omnitrophica bacterium]|nr:tRNA (adenosine(37)-N6)-dimethylallyltransferase MiaA [Candidatus Omnitrophota bacterium]